MGKLGVGMFFSLSGFLITFLLLVERDRKGDVNVGNFYLRRMLRILPLYLLIVLAAFFLFPSISILDEPNRSTFANDPYFANRLSLFLLILPNVAMVLFGSPYPCSPTWSIGVEEQFYFLWPWIVRSRTRKMVLKTIMTYVLVVLVVLGSIYYVFNQMVPASYNRGLPYYVNMFLSQFRIVVMMIGGAAAYLMYRGDSPLLRWLYRKDVQVVVYGILLVMLATGAYVPGFNLEVYAILFSYVILNVAGNTRTLIWLEQPVVSYLGKISYGLYIYHVIISILCINLIKRYVPLSSDWAFNLVLYSSVILMSVGTASLSFRYFEQPFLKLKDRYFSNV